MGEKLKSKTHLLNTFFLFLELFFARLASKFSKSSKMTKQIFEKSKSNQKTQNFTLILNPLKKLFLIRQPSKGLHNQVVKVVAPYWSI
jgi:hypothetical protein